jgi:hypothetical protein
MRFLAIVPLAVLAAVGGCTTDGGEEVRSLAQSLLYETEDVVISGSEPGTQLAGTLTWPTEICPCPTAILVQGAGSHDRDYTVFGHRPFQVLADHLARHGIATLRFDERGVGWRGRPTSSYDICYSTSSDPSTACQPVQPEMASREGDGGVLLGNLAVFLGLLAWPDRRRRHQWVGCFLLAFLGAAACSGDATGPGDVEPEVEEMTYTVSGLAPGTTYYWKIEAQSAPSVGFSSETVVFSFATTG